MLPDDDDVIPADTAESPRLWPRAIHEPFDEFQSMLAIVKRDIDPILSGFPMDLPTNNAAIVLAKFLRELYDITGKYMKGEKEGRRKILEDFRRATISAAIAAKLYTEDDLSVDRMTEIFQHLEQFQHKLNAVMRTYRPASPR